MPNGSDTIRIIRTGSGHVLVVPSPKQLAPGQVFYIKNLTDCPANADLTDVPVDPTTPESIEPGAKASFTARKDAPEGYYEYSVTITCSDQEGKRFVLYAEGGSRPGIIIDR